MKYLFGLICFAMVGCVSSNDNTQDAKAPNQTTTVMTIDKGAPKLDCVPVVINTNTVTVKMVTPDMIYFCSRMDVHDSLNCLHWEKAYQSMICIGHDCKTWIQGNSSEPFGTTRD